MTKIAICLSVFLLVAPLLPAQQAPRSSDDFLAPVSGGSTQVREPDKLTINDKKVSGPNAQDTINAAVQQNKKGLKKDHEGQDAAGSAIMVTFPSGMGFVATGASIYRTMENPVATRIAKRKAYVIAFTYAKKQLAATLNGQSSEGKEAIREALQRVNLPKEEMTNIATTSEQSVAQAVEMMLRGFVIYEVNDDTTQHAVTVSIVTTPKTRGKLARPATNRLEASTIRDALDQVIEEVRSGVVPPVGGRIITVRATGETAFVGFGGSVVGSNTNSAVQAKLKLAAQKVAAVYSKDALCGLIIGDRTSWAGRVSESQKDEVKEFEELTKEDPLAKNNPDAVRKLEKQRQTFVNKMQFTETYQSARKGVLPPGIITKTWFDEDHAWAYAMSVYVPSVTGLAQEAARDMDKARILGGSGGSSAGKDAGASGGTSGFTDENNPHIKKPGDTVRPGPSGKVGKDEDK